MLCRTNRPVNHESYSILILNEHSLRSEHRPLSLVHHIPSCTAYRIYRIYRVSYLPMNIILYPHTSTITDKLVTFVRTDVYSPYLYSAPPYPSFRFFPGGEEGKAGSGTQLLWYNLFWLFFFSFLHVYRSDWIGCDRIRIG